MIATLYHWLTSPPGQVAMGVVLVLVILPAVAWKAFQDRVNPRDRRIAQTPESEERTECRKIR